MTRLNIPLFILSLMIVFAVQAQDNSKIIPSNPDAYLNEDFLNNRTPQESQQAIDLSMFNVGIHPSVGISGTYSGIAPDVKIYLLETNIKDDPIKFNIFGIGYSPNKNKGLIVSPFNFRYNPIGISVDIAIKNENPCSGLTLNYSF